MVTVTAMVAAGQSAAPLRNTDIFIALIVLRMRLSLTETNAQDPFVTGVTVAEIVEPVGIELLLYMGLLSEIFTTSARNDRDTCEIFASDVACTIIICFLTNTSPFQALVSQVFSFEG